MIRLYLIFALQLCGMILFGQGICDSTVIINPVSAICPTMTNSPIQLEASHAGGNFYGDNITPNGLLYPDGLAPGDYQITYIIPSDGCSNYAYGSFTISGPAVNISISGELDCSADTPDPVSLFADYEPGGAATWVNGEGVEISFNATAEATTGGTYTLLLNNPDNTCPASVEIEIPQTGLPDISPAACSGCSPNLAMAVDNLPTGGSVNWVNKEKNIGLTGQCVDFPFDNESGSWEVIVQGFEHACVARDLVDVPGNGNTIPNINAGSDFTINCNNGIATLNGVHDESEWPFEIDWSTDDGHFVSDPAGLFQPYIDGPGTYHFNVSNPFTGCTVSDEVIVTGVFPTTFLDVSICEGEPFEGYLNSGTYIDTFSISPGCDSIRVLNLFIYPLPEVEGTTIADDGSGNGTVVLEVSNGETPYSFEWSTGETTTTPILTSLMAGDYDVTVTTAFLGCQTVYSFSIDLDPFLGGSTALLQGVAFFDSNNNCLLDSLEIGFEYIPTQITGDLTYSQSADSTGHYSYPIFPGNFNIQAVPPNPLWSFCEETIPFSINNDFDTVTVNYPLQAAVLSPWMHVEINTPFLRRCFENTYTINYTNHGTIPATDVQIEITFDDALDIVGSSIPWSEQNDNLFVFDIGEVNVGETGIFTVTVIPNCETTVPGQIHCVEAHIYPDTIPDIENLNWPGALISVEGECLDEQEIEFRIQNIGDGSMVNTLNYIVIEDAVLLNAGGYNLPSGETETLTFPASGATLWLRAEQEPGAPGNLFPGVAIEGCGTDSDGTFSTGYSNNFALNDLGNFEDTDCEQNIGSYDPNKKHALPDGYTADHFIEPGVPIEYKIQFQNTGTDTAFTVVLVDSLSNHLDINSFEMLASSHPYRWEIRPDRVLKFFFDDILLPDSNTNIIASQGFVKFRLQPVTNLPAGTLIFNDADIYFDFNAPVRTPSIFHTIWEGMATEVLTSLVFDSHNDTDVNVFPNPFAGQARVEINSQIQGDFQFLLYDALGRLLYKKDSTSPTFDISPKDLKSGTYFFVIMVDHEKIATGALIH